MRYESSRPRSAVVMVAAILTLLGAGFMLLAPQAKTSPEAAALVMQKLSDQSTLARKSEPPAYRHNMTDGQ